VKRKFPLPQTTFFLFADSAASEWNFSIRVRDFPENLYPSKPKVKTKIDSCAYFCPILLPGFFFEEEIVFSSSLSLFSAVSAFLVPFGFTSTNSKLPS